MTVSEYSRSRIIEILNVSPEKVSVVNCGIENHFFQVSPKQIRRVRQKYGLHGDYILSVSSISPRKNFERIFKAWKIINTKYKHVSLVIVGSRNLAFAANKELGKLPERTIITGYVEGQDLPAIYAGALSFIYPSLYEGFGIPILEAMATGTSVVTSNTTSMPEVAGDAAIYVNPYEVKSIAEGIERVIEEKKLREELEKKGKIRCKQFSWKRSSEQIWKILSTYAE